MVKIDILAFISSLLTFSK